MFQWNFMVTFLVPSLREQLEQLFLGSAPFPGAASLGALGTLALLRSPGAFALLWHLFGVPCGASSGTVPARCGGPISLPKPLGCPDG